MTAGRGRAVARLLALQAAWSYERMQGIGMGWAAEPLLADLRASDPARHPEATVRSAEFFNGHPYLAGLALGATVRAEYDGVPGAQVQRLRTAVGGPLGALGDQLFWAGLLPALVGAALLGVTLGAPGLAVGGLLVAWNALRLAVTAWGLGVGLREGLAVGRAIRASWLNEAAQRVGRLAGLAVGAALPAAAAWLLGGLTGPAGRTALAVAAVGAVLARLRPSWFTGVRYGLLLIAAVVLLTLTGRVFTGWLE
jgi:mannose/fructose/N-acetylgalactosamine-specific phosphotransferase system component IID